MNIIIPMAGMGKRMRPHTLTTAKPLIAIAGKPIVQRLVEDISATANAPIDEIAFIIAPHFGAEVEKMLLDVAESLGARGRICYQEEALGTAHAILCAADSLAGNVFVAFADTLFKADFKIDTEKDAIIWTQQVADPSAFGVVKLAADGQITDFVEKPDTFVSDLAIIGVYYFKDGENLKRELQFLLDNNIAEKGEYQLTTAMENMKNKGLKFYSDQVEEWLDCGNKEATVYTNQRILEIKKDTETLVHATAVTDNATIVAPCYLGPDVVVKNAVVGPHVSLEAGAAVTNAIISNSMVGEKSVVKNAILANSMVGKSVLYSSKPEEMSLGDFSTIA
ncbi:MAG: sugar phosphate nucleotidyltransferase [Edaphocola sp.]